MKAAAAYRPQAEDTSAAVDRQLVELWRAIPASDKLRRVAADCRAVEQLTLAGIYARYPDANRREVRQHLAVLRLGAETAAASSTGAWMTNTPSDPIDVAMIVAAVLGELGVAYVIGGAVASSVHGEPRATEDLDIVVDLGPDDVAPLIRKLESEFYVPVGAVRDAVARQTSFSVIHRPSVRKVDIFVAGSEPINRAELARATNLPVSTDPPRHLSIATAEDILLQKLQWFEKGGRVSDRQWRDVLGILKAQANRLDRAYVDEWARHLRLEALLRTALKEAGLEDVSGSVER